MNSSDYYKDLKNLQPSNFIILTFKFVGVWSFPEKDWFLLHQIYSLLVLFSFQFMFTVTMFINVGSIKSLDDTTESLYMCLTMTSMLVKIFTLLVKRSEILAIVTKLRDNQITQIRSNEENEEFVSNYKLFNRMRKGFLIICFLCIFCGFIGPLFAVERKFPFPAWFPFNWKENDKIYLIFYFYEIIAMIISCLTNTTLDVFFAYLFFQLSMYFRLIGIRLKNIGWSRSLNKKDLNLSELIENIKLHQEIVLIKECVENVVSVPIFIQLNVSAFVICFTAYQLMMISIVENAGTFLLYFYFIIAMVMEIFLPCYFGDLLTQRSDALMNAIYNSNWMEEPLKFQKTVVIFMEFLKKPIIVRAGILFKISLRIFTSVINNSYNLFALLLKMNRRRK